MLRKIFYFTFFLLCILLLNGQDSFGQANRKKQRKLRSTSRKIASFTGKSVKFDARKRYNGLGINLSSMNYFGDIAPKARFTSTDFQFSRPQFGITYMRRLGPRFTARGSFSWGRISGDDFYAADKEDVNAKFRYVRNLHFRNDIKELSAVGVYDLLENRGNYLRRVEFTPYVFGGIAVFYHNPKAKAPTELSTGLEGSSGKWVSLQPLGTEGQGWLDGAKKPYSKVQLSFPVGVGLRYRLNDALDLSFEVGYRYTLTDYLDDISGAYVREGQLASAPNPLTGIMSDLSAEGKAPRTGADRDMVLVNSVLGRNKSYSDYSETATGAAIPKRGTPNKDVYIVSGFHLTYVFIGTGIFGGNRRNAKFR